MAITNKEDEQKLAAMKLKIDAMELELNRLVREYDPLAAAHEMTKVVNQKNYQALLQKSL